jgi:ribose 5-phosphate isomerase A
VDITIDGADEIDPLLRAIKGAGGALLREKIIAAASDCEIIIVDSSKPVATLGRAKLPVEVLPFAARFVERELAKLGAPLKRRTNTDGSDFRTDQDAFIYDISLGSIADPEGLASELEKMPGLIGHGLFLNQIDLAIIAIGTDVQVVTRAGAEARRGRIV